jgi:hypothetical protein
MKRNKILSSRAICLGKSELQYSGNRPKARENQGQEKSHAASHPCGNIQIVGRFQDAKKTRALASCNHDKFPKPCI